MPTISQDPEITQGALYIKLHLDNKNLLFTRQSIDLACKRRIYTYGNWIYQVVVHRDVSMHR